MGSPITITFGSWAPDLANVGVVTAWASAVPNAMPCSDILNVYWRDGGYRSLPGPASIGPTLGVPITAVANWYDNSTGKEEIFAATANAIYVLVDGTWTQLPVQSNSSTIAIGQVMTITEGAPSYVSVSISPATQSLSGTSNFCNFSAEVASVALGTPTAYTWSLSGQMGPGTFVIFSGQGTPSCNVDLTGASPNSTTSTITLTCQITIGAVNYPISSVLSYTDTYVTGTYSGSVTSGTDGAGSIGFQYGSFGSVSPTSDSNGHAIFSLYNVYDSYSGVWDNYFSIRGFSSDPGAGYVTTLTIRGTNYLTSSMTYSYAAGIATWILTSPTTAFNLPASGFAGSWSFS